MTDYIQNSPFNDCPLNWYISRKLPIFPVLANDKKPLINNWQNESSIDLEKIEAWKEQFPRCNWAMITGRESKVFVVDVDNKDAKNGLATLDMLEKSIGKLETKCISTPSGGRHYYFLWDKRLELFSGTVGILPGIDIRTTGNYVVIPPSIIGEKSYSFLNESEIMPFPTLAEVILKYAN